MVKIYINGSDYKKFMGGEEVELFFEPGETKHLEYTLEIQIDIERVSIKCPERSPQAWVSLIY